MINRLIQISFIGSLVYFVWALKKLGTHIIVIPMFFGTSIRLRYALVPFWRGIFILRLPVFLLVISSLIYVYYFTPTKWKKRATLILATIYTILFFLGWFIIELIAAAL